MTLSIISTIVPYLAIGIVAIVGGIAIGYFIKIKNLSKKAEAIIEEAKLQAGVIKKDKELEAKETFLKLKTEHEEQANQRNQRLRKFEKKLKQFEANLNSKKEDVQKKAKQIELKKKEIAAIRQNLETQITVLDEKQQNLDNLYNSQVKKLESIAGMNKNEAKEQLIESLKEEAKADAMTFVSEIVEDAKLRANEEARNIVIKSMQRIGSDVAANNSITVFNIDNDEIKGRIIGREGRNIRTLEAATGVEIVVDDTPEAIVLSSFDPLRREVARLALHQLVADGRIHPARIEAIVKKTKKQLEEEVLNLGKRTCIDLGIHGVNAQLMRIIGKMKYRSSYGQNLLHHSIETAKLCAVMASELGLNPKIAKRAGLLHDIGKVPEEETDLPHAIYGMKIAEKFNEKPQVCNAIGSHHDEIEMTSLYAPLVQICDGISGARPGARREIMDSYTQRLEELEKLALGYKGVTKSYAIQAGRELRVIVGSDKVSDKDAETLSYDIAKKIQKEMTYPGQVKITVIREKRSVNFAK